jgi:hypothetical protein
MKQNMLLSRLDQTHTRLAILLLALSALALPARAALVDIPDANLRRAVESALDPAKGIDEPIDETEMAGLVNLNNAANRGIVDLTGLETAVNLQTLLAYNNQISDLTPLAGLTSLKQLELDNNQISNAAPLSGLTGLERLVLLQNQIIDPSPLATLTSLTTLNLSSNQISDISSLAVLTNLNVLFLGNNQISDLTPLSGLTGLTELSLSNNLIDDIDPLATLVNLSVLYLNDNLLTNIDALDGFTQLDQLSLQNNYLDVSEGSDTRLIIDAIDAGAEVAYTPQFELPDPDGYAAWVAFWAIPSGQDGYDDTNGPLAFRNIIAYSMGLNPYASIPGQVPTATLDRANDQYAFFYLRDTNATGITRTIESSTDLDAWLPATPDEEVILSDDDGVQSVKALFNDTGSKRFFLLRVEPDELLVL